MTHSPAPLITTRMSTTPPSNRRRARPRTSRHRRRHVPRRQLTRRSRASSGQRTGQRQDRWADRDPRRGPAATSSSSAIPPSWSARSTAATVLSSHRGLHRQRAARRCRTHRSVVVVRVGLNGEEDSGWVTMRSSRTGLGGRAARLRRRLARRHRRRARRRRRRERRRRTNASSTPTIAKPTWTSWNNVSTSCRRDGADTYADAEPSAKRPLLGGPSGRRSGRGTPGATEARH